jgi:ABC-type transporter Mla subunit MlaD
MPLSPANEQLRDQIIQRITRTKQLATTAKDNYGEGIESLNAITQQIIADVERLNQILLRVTGLAQQCVLLEDTQAEIQAVLQSISGAAGTEDQVEALTEALDNISEQLGTKREEYSDARQRLTEKLEQIHHALNLQEQELDTRRPGSPPPSPGWVGGYTYPKRRTLRRRRKAKKVKKTHHKKRRHNKKRKTHRRRK